jgi:hypothetical protein
MTANYFAARLRPASSSSTGMAKDQRTLNRSRPKAPRAGTGTGNVSDCGRVFPRLSLRARGQSTIISFRAPNPVLLGQNFSWSKRARFSNCRFAVRRAALSNTRRYYELLRPRLSCVWNAAKELIFGTTTRRYSILPLPSLKTSANRVIGGLLADERARGRLRIEDQHSQ